MYTYFIPQNLLIASLHILFFFDCLRNLIDIPLTFTFSKAHNLRLEDEAAVTEFEAN